MAVAPQANEAHRIMSGYVRGVDIESAVVGLFMYRNPLTPIFRSENSESRETFLRFTSVVQHHLVDEKQSTQVDLPPRPHFDGGVEEFL